MNDLNNIKALLDKPAETVIITHQKPDGDAMGSMLSFYHLLTRKGHNVTPISPTEYGHYLQWMPGQENIVDYQENPEKALQKLELAELIVCVDFNNPKRTNGLQEYLIKANGTKLVIDHHTNPEPFYDHIICEPEFCATAELIYQIIDNLWGNEVIDHIIATCLYTGIVTDSGSFRFSNVTPSTHKIAAYLIGKSIDHAAIHRNLFENTPARKLKFFGHCLTNRLEIIPECKTAFIYVTMEDKKQYDVQTGETEGLVNYPLSIEGIVFAALFKEQRGIIKISFRSIGKFPANEFAAKHFEGGGHHNASGGRSHENLNETLKNFRKTINEYKDELEKA